MKPEELKYLDYIQNAITRMADNSFKLKGLAITVLAAFLALYVKFGDYYLLLMPVLPSFIFWVLDSYYLQQEKKFRKIYNHVAGVEKAEGLDDIIIFEIPINKVKEKSVPRIMFSKTEWSLYLLLILLLLGIFTFSFFSICPSTTV